MSQNQDKDCLSDRKKIRKRVYLDAQAASGFKIGDWAKVLGGAVKGTGWEGDWDLIKQSMIGKVFRIDAIDDAGIRLVYPQMTPSGQPGHPLTCYFPYFVLEKRAKPKPPILKERPILFNSDMVRAILSGKKTQTRRPLWNSGQACKCPWEKGQRLWVRETFAPADDTDNPRHIYRADGVSLPPERKRWIPSIHMPRETCRIILEVDDVRQETLAKITQDDAASEGFPDRNSFLAAIRKMYPRLRNEDSTVWVITFHVISQES